jgi:hypothetical protein
MLHFGDKIFTSFGATIATSVKTPYRAARQTLTSLVSETTVDSRFCAVLKAMKRKKKPGLKREMRG